MTTYARDEAAQRCGCDRAWLDRLIELGILTPKGSGRPGAAGDPVGAAQRIPVLELTPDQDDATA